MKRQLRYFVATTRKYKRNLIAFTVAVSITFLVMFILRRYIVIAFLICSGLVILERFTRKKGRQEKFMGMPLFEPVSLLEYLKRKRNKHNIKKGKLR